MNKAEAQVSIKNIQTEVTSLHPNNVITLFEIDTTSLSSDLGLIYSTQLLTNPDLGIFRFHNSIKLFKSSIFWQGKEFFAAPITAEGFEYNSSGTLPRPKVSITSSPSGINEFARLKRQIFEMGDIIGAKFTRIRTFAKYLDARNYIDKTAITDSSPDMNAEFPREIYYFDRKSNEDKLSIEYELASILDVQEIKLPGRIVTSNVCTAMYRGCGCLYEYQNRRVDNVHGDSSESQLPLAAPPVANERDEKIEEILGTSIVDRGEYQSNISYKKGHAIFLQKNGVNYYFVASVDSPLKPPPNKNYWIADYCSRSQRGCKLRWGHDGAVIVGNSGITKGRLMFNGFPATNKLIR
jgi:lambda family phage minor tail protein L